MNYMKEKEIFKLNGFIGVLIELLLIVGTILSIRTFILSGEMLEHLFWK